MRAPVPFLWFWQRVNLCESLPGVLQARSPIFLVVHRTPGRSGRSSELLRFLTLPRGWQQRLGALLTLRVKDESQSVGQVRDGTPGHETAAGQLGLLLSHWREQPVQVLLELP